MPTVFTRLHHRMSRRLRRIFVGIGITLWAAATLTALAPILPHVAYRLSPGTPAALASTIATTSLPTPDSSQARARRVLPPADPALPDTNLLLIDKIGVEGPIHEGDDAEAELEKGVWITPGWDDPSDPDRPLVLASHRWGYLDWSNDFRRKNSFYSLPRLEEGDVITLIIDQRQYEFEIYLKDEGTTPTDLSSDLILYTCQLWNSPVRIFLYARRTN